MIKRIFFIFLLATIITNCKSKSSIVTSKDEAVEKGIYSYNEKNSKTKVSKKSSSKSVNATRIQQDLIDDAKSNLGVKYRLGGTTKTGMDCSGLVFSTFENFDIKLPRTSIDMSRHGKKISINKAQPGDLIFFTTNGRSVINHVGIITEVTEDEIKFIHSSTSQGVIISSTADSYYGNAFAQINRVLN